MELETEQVLQKEYTSLLVFVAAVLAAGLGATGAGVAQLSALSLPEEMLSSGNCMLGQGSLHNFSFASPSPTPSGGG